MSKKTKVQEETIVVPNRKFSKKGGVIERRKRVIERLEAQLKTKLKPVKTSADAFAGPYQESLDEKDIKRIKTEIAILKTRLS